VDIGGYCAQNEAGRNLCPKKAPNCDQVKSQYYFYLALENDQCNDYVTEKYWDNLALPVILIVAQRSIYEGYVQVSLFLKIYLNFEYIH
jgi:hypothetical protein